MTRKIYVVTEGEYSDYRICGVFTSKKNAEAFITAFGGEIEEHVANPCVPEIRQGCEPWFVRMALDGTVIEAYIDRSSYGFLRTGWPARDVKGNLIEHVMARSKEHAVKIVNDKRARLIAEGKT